MNENGHITAIEEGNHEGKGLMNTNMFALDSRIFDYPMVSKAEGSDEYGLPQTVLNASKAAGIPLHAVPAAFWIQVTAPEDLQRAATILRERV